MWRGAADDTQANDVTAASGLAKERVVWDEEAYVVCGLCINRRVWEIASKLSTNVVNSLCVRPLCADGRLVKGGIVGDASDNEQQVLL